MVGAAVGTASHHHFISFLQPEHQLVDQFTSFHPRQHPHPHPHTSPSPCPSPYLQYLRHDHQSRDGACVHFNIRLMIGPERGSYHRDNFNEANIAIRKQRSEGMASDRF